jgi:putative DNA primase/helicase
MSDRTYLVVPFAEKDNAKALGAKFDRDAKTWFVPPGVDPAPFARWCPDQPRHDDPRSLFAARLKDAGFILGNQHPIIDGQIHHCPVEGGSKGEQSGSYRAYADGIPNGWYQNFKVHEKPLKWVMRTHVPEAVRETIKTRAAQHQQEAGAARKDAHDQAAAGYQRLWDGGSDDVSAHPYLVSKGLTAVTGLRIAGPNATVAIDRRRDAQPVADPWMMKAGGLDGLDAKLKASAERSYTAWAEAKPELARRHDLADYVSYVQERWAKDKRANTVDISIAGRLLIPMRNIDGQLRSLQIIDDQGGKMFAPGGEVGGSHFVLGNVQSPWPLHFTEGYATGRAIHDATGHTVVVTFSAHNLAPVADAYRKRDSDRTLMICADNDHQKERDTDTQGRPKKNVGREKGETAAQQVRGHLLLPPFAEGDKGKDWDDYRRQHGIEGLRMELTKQTASITRQKLAREFAAARDFGREANTRTLALAR